jgi:hypothetical protein
MIISKELIELSFTYDFGRSTGTNKVDKAHPIFDRLEDLVYQQFEEDLKFNGDIPWFVVSDDNIKLLFVVYNESDTYFELEFAVDFTGKIYWGELSNMKGMSEEFTID